MNEEVQKTTEQESPEATGTQSNPTGQEKDRGDGVAQGGESVSSRASGTSTRVRFMDEIEE